MASDHETMVYRPDHPMANENGMVPKRLVPPPGVDPRLYVITDGMQPTWHPATGEVFESKAAFRAATRASGCIEVGNEPLASRPRPKPPRAAPFIAQAIEQLSSR